MQREDWDSETMLNAGDFSVNLIVYLVEKQYVKPFKAFQEYEFNSRFGNIKNRIVINKHINNWKSAIYISFLLLEY